MAVAASLGLGDRVLFNKIKSRLIIASKAFYLFQMHLANSSFEYAEDYLVKHRGFNRKNKEFIFVSYESKQYLLILKGIYLFSKSPLDRFREVVKDMPYLTIDWNEININKIEDINQLQELYSVFYKAGIVEEIR